MRINNRKDVQKIWTSRKCPYNCAFCYNGGKLEVLPIPMIKSNYVLIQDPAFLSIPEVKNRIRRLGEKKVNDKVVYYELTQGINYKDLSLDIAKLLYKNRFKNIRFAWDWQYNRNYMFKIYDTVKILTKVGYKPNSLMCYSLVNWVVPFEDCIKKMDLFKVWNIKIGDCCYNGGYPKNEIDFNKNKRFNKARNWKYSQIKYFRKKSRKHNQILCGIDPELK